MILPGIYKICRKWPTCLFTIYLYFFCTPFTNFTGHVSENFENLFSKLSNQRASFKFNIEYLAIETKTKENPRYLVSFILLGLYFCVT